MKKYSTMSLVWKYFKVKETDVSKVVCLLCFPGGDDESNPNVKYLSRGPKMKSFSTKPMWNHLRSMHPVEHEISTSQQQQGITAGGARKDHHLQLLPLILGSRSSFVAHHTSLGTPTSFGSPSSFGSPNFGSTTSWPTAPFGSPGSFGLPNIKTRDGKLEVGGFTGLSESSAGSGDNQGACDEISIPLSPEQFMSEETEQGGGSPHTPPPQRPESYKLRHNNHLNLVLESLAGDESFMDVTLTAQGKAIKAHKSVLSAVSPYFRSVLKENPCQHPIIIMPRDIRFEELNSIISYVYKGEMTVAAEDLSSLLKTAEILQVTGLSPSETSGSTGGIMSQVQGIPAGLMTNTPSKKYSKKHHTHQILQQQHAHTQQQQDDDDDESMNDDTTDPHGRVDPLEFLKSDMTCVKEEIRSDNEEDSESIPLPMGGSGSNNVSEAVAVSDSSNASPNRRNSASRSPKPVEDIISKPFNPGEPGGSSSADESPCETPPGSSPFMCPHCLEIHRPLDSLQSHLRLKHPSKSSFVCACGRVFGRIIHLTEHSKRCKF